MLGLFGVLTLSLVACYLAYRFIESIVRGVCSGPDHLA